ncbi:MAG TPA: heparinase II/III family protein [Capsulimonadaceae bacterium]|jgi:hypothetical protein
MKNLIYDDLTFDEVASAFAGPRPSLLPKLGDAEWVRAASNPHVATIVAPLLPLATAERDEPMPVLTDELYADYPLTGRRVVFEHEYFERRRRLARAAIFTVLDGKGASSEWYPSLLAKLTDVFNETSWALPAHTTTSTGKDPLRLDLFACETANLMGEMLTVFGDVLPIELTARIRERLRYTVFENYATHPDNMWWRKITNNWNAVCHQGVLGAALAVETDVKLLTRVLMTAREALPLFLDGFGADGGCSEGPGYWSYGFGWFTFLNEQLETASGGKLSVFAGDNHIAVIARYAVRARFSNGYMINFADGAAKGRMNPFVLGYLGKRLMLPELAADATGDYADIITNRLNLDDHRLDFMYLGRLLLSCPTEIEAPTASFSRDCYFGDLQVLEARRTDAAGNLWEFAAKAGNNDEHHNHNDIGSYILNVNGGPVATEIGAPEYNREFFGPTRYEYLAARTLGHSLPVVNGVEQAAGREYAGTVIAHEIAPDHVRFDVDFTAAYPEAAHLTKLVRRFDLDVPAGRLTVSDEYTLSSGNQFETAIATNQGVEAVEGAVTILSPNARVNVNIGDNAVSFETHAYNDHSATARTITRIVLKPKLAATSGVVGYSFTVA